MSHELTVTVVQHASSLDAGENRAALDELVPAGSDLVVLPEAMARDFGQPGSPLGEYAEATDGPFATALARVAQERGTTVVAGMFESAEDPERPYNTLLARGRTSADYRKIHLYDSFGHRERPRHARPAGRRGCRLRSRWLAGRPAHLLRPALPRARPRPGGRRRRGAGAARGVGGGTAQGRALAHPAARAGDREHRVRRRGRPTRPPLHRSLDGGGPRRRRYSRRAGEGEETATATLTRELLDEVRRTNPSLANRRM